MAVKYRDPTPLKDAEKRDIQGLAGSIRTKMYGLDVREAIASALEKVSSDKSTYVSTPKGIYPDYDTLNKTFPNGTTGVYITKNTGHWWVYDYEHGQWSDGGPYQAAEIAYGSVTYPKRTRMGSTGYIIVGATTQIRLTSANDKKSIEITGNFWITDGSQPTMMSTTVFSLGEENGNILFDTDNNSIYIMPFGNHPNDRTERSLYLGTWFAGDIINLNAPNTKIIVNGKIQNNYLPKTSHLLGMILASDDIVIDSSNKTATCLGQINVIDESGYTNSQVTLDFSNLDPERANTVYYDPADNKIKTTNNKDNSGFEEMESVIVVGIMYGISFNKHAYFNTNTNVIIDGVVSQRMNGDKEMYKTPIACLGDSLTAGLIKTGGHYTAKPYPYWIGVYFGGHPNNIAISGGSFYGDTEKDFKKQYSSVDFSKYEIITIAFGINDYYNNYALNNVVDSLKAGLDKMYKDNPAIRIAGILPQMSWHNDKESLTTLNDANYTLDDLCNELVKAYEEYQIPYFDWRKAPIVNKHNYSLITSDGTHLNDSSYQIMGRRISEFLKLSV